ncbi:sensor histidine kinase [Massilia endophytica]|uniref:sensor histidine kinase n=1 Tax=Massilia endophytica TaxID=2899220 RepID=UPI001E5AA7CF|nr:histidine kinase [Massilia endophytica]UGQ47264.1 histidine kinase [Massilia endophytica]
MNPVAKRNAIGFVREVGETASALWWQFFDWLAQVPMRQLVVTWVLALLLGCTPILLPEQAAAFVLISLGLKVLAGGKRKAEIEARKASEQAGTETLERKLVEAQMAALQAQVEPHFLFNTLALIGQLIETDPPQAAKIHTHLIEYLRSTLPQMRARGSGTLGRQIALSRSYLAIMQARMKSRLSVSIDVPPELESATFPPMMLQILIENCIKHGLEPKIEGGRIDIRASVNGNMMQVDVQDDGVGFSLYAGDGVGLTNIRERLKLVYGTRAQLLIEQPAEGGCRASIRVPFAPDIFAGAPA